MYTVIFMYYRGEVSYIGCNLKDVTMVIIEGGDGITEVAHIGLNQPLLSTCGMYIQASFPGSP